MSIRRDTWLRRRAQARAAAPAPQVTASEIRVDRSVVRVTLRGRDLIPLAGPVRIVVGGEQLRDVHFEGGDVITGTLARMPTSDDVDVALGPIQRSIRR